MLASRSRFGKSEVLDLTGVNEIRHRARDIFYRHVQINSMLIQQVDALHSELLE
jgi:hypothetical protein